MPPILLAYAEEEESLAEAVAKPLHAAGYEVLYQGTLLVGDSLVQRASQALEAGSPVVLCGTITALGTGWAHQVVNAARAYPGARIFGLQMEKRAYLQQLTLDGRVAEYWRDPNKAISELIKALQEYYPVESTQDSPPSDRIERRYRELALRTYDIVDLANLPVVDRNLAARQLLLRSLYVSLRVAVETTADSTGIEDTLSKVEARRRRPSPMELTPRVESNSKRWSVGERLRLARRLVILGDPGAGKSTLLRWIATAYLLRLSADPDWRELPDITTLPDEDWLPILVRCRDLDESYISSPLEDILSRHLKKFGMASSEAEGLNKLLLDRLSHGRALLLLDGLDEIVSPTARASFSRQIEQVSVAYPDAPIIATSRIVGYREIGLRIGRGFEHSTVLDLTAEDKDEFVHRWCIVTEPMIRRESAEEELVSDIHSTDRIEGLTGNPMLLTTMALVKKKVGKLPSKRADLYREAVEVLLNWRSEVDELLDPYEAMPQLEYIAYTMCRRGVQQLRADEIIGLLGTMRKEYPSVRAARRHEPLEFLQLLERRTGILMETGSVKFKGQFVPVYEFRHLTFQEYLAGLSLVAGRFPNRDRKRSLAANVAPLAAQTMSTGVDNESEQAELTVTENWREALRLCVMSCNDDDVDSVLLAIAKPHENEDATLSSRPRAVLALSCLSDEPNVSEDVAVELIDRFVNVLQENDGSGPSRTVADRALYEVGKSLWGPFVAERIVKEWCSRRDEARWMGGSAATVLGRLTPIDYEALRKWQMDQLRKLSSDTSIDRICSALTIMDATYRLRREGSLPSVSPIVPKLIEMLKQSWREVEAGAWALGWLGADLSEAEDLWIPSARQKAALISRIKNPKTSPMAAGFLLWPLRGNQSTDKRLVLAVANHIANSAEYGDSINSLTQEYARLFSSYIDPILPLLSHSSARVRSRVAAALGETGDASAVEPLARVLTDADGSVVDSVATALGRIGDASAVEPLARVLTDADADVVDSVAAALGDIGDASAVEPLVRVLTDAEGIVRYSVAAALGRIGDASAVEPLVRVLTDADGIVRYSVAAALGDIGDATAVEPLARVLTDPDGSVVDSVTAALGRIGDASAVEPLARVLADADGSVVDSVAAALGDIGDASAVEPLARVLTDADGSVVDSVATALGRIGDASAVEPLVRVLTDADGIVRYSVAAALGDIGDATAVEPLARVLTDAEGIVRYSVAAALGRIGDASAVEPLVRVLTDADGSVVDSVAAALGDIGDASAVEPLARVLTDADGNVVDSVATALGRTGDASAVEPLARVLTDADGNVVDSVATALGRTGDASAVEPLLKSTRARKLRAPSPAVAALANLGVDWALLEFQELLKGPSTEKRKVALWAMALAEREEYDRILLSEDADGISPGIDPAQSIKLGMLKYYANETGLTVDEICRRYKLLQSKYGLQLTW